MNLTSADIAGDRDVIARAEAIRDAVAAASDEIETTRRLPADLLDRLHEARLFRLLLPRSTDGIKPIHLLPAIGHRQGRCLTAWCLSQAGGCVFLSRCRSRGMPGPCWPGLARRSRSVRVATE